MDIKVGEIPRLGRKSDRKPATGGMVEGRILATRAPRRRVTGPPTDRVERRAQDKPRDPVNGRVLVLLVPDRAALPPDLEEGNYRVFRRFARR